MPMSDFKYIIRVVDTDLDGIKKVRNSLRKIKGVSFSVANAICIVSGIDGESKTGELTDEQVKKLDETLKNIETSFPEWMLNRRRDMETGEKKHLVATKIAYHKEFDVRRLKKIKSYRGMRHQKGLPSRGQRTRSNFRRNKGKVIGVARTKQGKKS